MIKCGGEYVEVSGSSKEILHEFVAVCRALAVMFEQHKKRPDVDVWGMLHRLVAKAQEEEHNAVIYDLSGLTKQRERGDDC